MAVLAVGWEKRPLFRDMPLDYSQLTGEPQHLEQMDVGSRLVSAFVVVKGVEVGGNIR